MKTLTALEFGRKYQKENPLSTTEDMMQSYSDYVNKQVKKERNAFEEAWTVARAKIKDLEKLQEQRKVDWDKVREDFIKWNYKHRPRSSHGRDIITAGEIVRWFKENTQQKKGEQSQVDKIKCPLCSTEMKGIKLTHYKCKKCNEYFTD